jgi:hypothetical protein
MGGVRACSTADNHARRARVRGALRRAVELSFVSVGWNTIVGLAAVGTALATGSLSLIGFGINAVVDSSVSVLLIRRFRAEERGHDERAARAEERAEQVAGIAFVLIAAYLTAQAVRALINGTGHAASVFAIGEAEATSTIAPARARRRAPGHAARALLRPGLRVRDHPGHEPARTSPDVERSLPVSPICTPR